MPPENCNYIAARLIEDKNGHILPYVKFEGGSLDFTNDALNILKQF